MFLPSLELWVFELPRALLAVIGPFTHFDFPEPIEIHLPNERRKI
jgi:hypothetical protein